MDSRLLQLADSAFPTGAFAHSFGFEAVHQLGKLRDETSIVRRLREFIWHTATSTLPFFNAAFDLERAPTVNGIVALDRWNEMYLSNHIARRASTAQGRAFLLASEATLEGTEASTIIRALREELPHAHVAVAMGSTFRAIDVARADARRVHLFAALRGVTSALVRLGAMGPLRSQKLMFDLHPLLDEALDATEGLLPDDATSVAPFLEIAQTLHDRLYSRLFQS